MKCFNSCLAVAVLILSMALTSCEDDASSEDDAMYYTVTFDSNGSQIDGATMITVAKGEKVYAYPSLMPPENYTFSGWYREAELINEWDSYNDVVTGDMTLYAGWKRIYTFTFYGNGGIFHNRGGSETLMYSLSDGARLQYPENLIRPGYLLEGWYRDAGLTDKWDFGADVVTGDGSLYAKWDTGIEGLTLESYPRVDGATSTRALSFVIACKLLGFPYVWNVLSETGELSVWPKNDHGSPDETLFDGRIKTSQTHVAMLNLIEGEADIILRSTTASPDEKVAAEAAGVTLIETPIALDAFVFIKNPANPVRSLTLEQIRKIYTKQITNWSEVGGNNAPMKVFTRPRNSGSEEAFRELVMNGLEPAEFPEEQQAWSMAGLFWEMEREANGIGYIFKNYKEKTMRRYEPAFAVNGISPDPTTIKNRTYPLTTEVYAIIRSDLDHNSMAYKLYEWLQTESAKAVLEECGFSSY